MRVSVTNILGKEDLVLDDYINGYSLNKLQKKYKTSVETLKALLYKNNIQLKDSSFYTKCKTSTEFTKEQCEFIDGSLLSDGFLNQRGNQTPKYRLGSKYEEYCNHAKQFVGISGNVSFNTIKAHYIKEKWCPETYIYLFFSHSDLALNSFDNRWYIKQANNKRLKVVPKDIVFTPRVLKEFYYGDGSRNDETTITFHTEGFSLEDNLFILDNLINLGFTGKVYNCKSRNYQNYIILQGRKNTYNFLDYIGECELDCFKYKWK